MTRLSAIRKRLEAATPGPWRALESWYLPKSGISAWNVASETSLLIREQTPENAQLIAHAPQDLRDLLALAEAAKAVKEWLHWPAVVGAFSLQAIHGGVPLEISDKAQDILVRFEAIVARLDAPEVEG